MSYGNNLFEAKFQFSTIKVAVYSKLYQNISVDCVLKVALYLTCLGIILN